MILASTVFEKSCFKIFPGVKRNLAVNQVKVHLGLSFELTLYGPHPKVVGIRESPPQFKEFFNHGSGVCKKHYA